MKRILVVSWFYPPVNSSEGLVTYKLLKNSKKEYDICMQTNNVAWSYGISKSLPKADNVHCIFAKSKSLNTWVEEVTNYFIENKDKYDILMTRSMPPESHKIGINIKKIKPEIKWIASFGDPIADNPFVLKCAKRISPYSLENRYIRPMGLKEIFSPKRFIKNTVWNIRTKRAEAPYDAEKKLEKEIILKADYFIFNSIYQMEYMLKAYEENIKEKGIVLPHSFDNDLYPEVVEKKSDKIRMVYVGHLDDTRTPHLLFKAINLLQQQYDGLAERVELLFYGNMSSKEKVYLIDNELLDIVKVKRPVDYKKSLEIMKESDWLIHIDANLHDVLDYNIFFAAKLADYIGAGKKILALTMSEGASMDILEKVGALSVSYSVEEIKNYLYLIIYKGYETVLDSKVANEYNAKEVAVTFDKFVDGIE